MITKLELNSFIGTENYYNHWTKTLVYTDGIKFLADKTNSHWFIDVIASYQTKEMVKNCPFQIWKIQANPDKTGIVTMREDSDKPVVISQELKYTDFPFDELEVYCIDKVILLKSEY